MFNKKITTILILMFLTAGNSYAAFMDAGHSARAMGMGGAFTAVADDGNAPLWNSAGPATVEELSLNFTHTKLFTGLDGVDLSQNYFSFIFPTAGIRRLMNFGTFAVSWTNVSARDLYSEDAIMFSYSLKLNRYLDAGAGLKYLSRIYILDKYSEDYSAFEDRSSATDFSADAGIMVRPSGNMDEGFRIGLSAQNIIPADIGIDEEEIISPVYKAGVSYKLPPLRMLNTIRLSGGYVTLDMSYRDQDWGQEKHKINTNFGLETNFLQDSLSLRCGVNMDEAALGAGYKTEIEGIATEFNYSFALPFNIRDSYGTHRFSVATSF
ncbi:MAG: hypothetical protein ACQESB_02225 [Elusimicrobiota bacterium]